MHRTLKAICGIALYCVIPPLSLEGKIEFNLTTGDLRGILYYMHYSKSSS